MWSESEGCRNSTPQAGSRVPGNGILQRFQYPTRNHLRYQTRLAPAGDTGAGGGCETFLLVPGSSAYLQISTSCNNGFFLPSIFSIIFQREGRTDWWKPNHTSRPPPRGLEQPSDAVKKERPTGVYLPGRQALFSSDRISHGGPG